MAIEIDGTEYRTERQWERVHRHLRKNAKGVWREWKSPRGGKEGAWFYPRTQTKEWTDAERRCERRAKREAEAEREVAARIGEAVDRAVSANEVATAIEGTGAPAWEFEVREDFVATPHDAAEWVAAGFVPLAEARWFVGDYGILRCDWWDVRWMPERAEELMESGPREGEADRLPDGRPYDGRPWWVC